MAEEPQYDTHKRKYDEQTTTSPPRPRRTTGFSDTADTQPEMASYNHVPPPMDEFEATKQKLQEIASRALNIDVKRSNGASDHKPLASNNQVGNGVPIPSHSYSGPGSKIIEIPNGRVGVIIGKAGETIKYLQMESGAKIQVTRDADHDPHFPSRNVELVGNEEQIARAEQLINEVLAEADAGGPVSMSRRSAGSTGSEQFSMQVPNNKVGLVIGKGGESIKNIQTTSGARVQVIPLHPPPGDTSNERTVQISGTAEQIEVAKQMVNEVIENRQRNPAMSEGYSQQGYQAQPPVSWAPQPQVQQPAGYGYMQQQPGAYPGAPSPYSGYPTQSTPGGYTQNWDQSSVAQTQQAQGTGYDYYGQQAPQQQQQLQYGGYGQQGYYQDGYGGGYSALPAQAGYGQPPTNPQSGYDQQLYGSTPGYCGVTNPPQEGHSAPYGTQGETGQGPSPAQQGYTGQPSSNPAYSGYGTPAQAQAQGGYTQPSPASYGGTTTQPSAYPVPYGAPPVTPPSYGQQPHAYYGAYPQQHAYSTDGYAAGAAAVPAPAPTSQPAVQPSGAAKTTP